MVWALFYSDYLMSQQEECTGAGPIGRPYVRWGTHFADFDNDGWADLYAAGGHLAPRIVRTFGKYRKGTSAAYVEAGDRAFDQKTVLLHNLGEGRFAEWMDSGDLGRQRMSARGSAVADIDGDGALDLVVVDIDGPVRVFRNALPARPLDRDRAQGCARRLAGGARDPGGGHRRGPHAGPGLPRLAVLRVGLARPAALRPGLRGGR